ncbi:MAG: ABC transporter substrate-binding protein [Firmicutes bacterium]|nr:ABC transporter substrate-binding protein [Bacillota bacterium]
MIAKIYRYLPIFLGILLLSGCGGPSTLPGQVSQKPGSYKIGVMIYNDAYEIQAVETGFMQALTEAGFIDGANAEFEVINAYEDKERLSVIAKKFATENKKLIFAVSTPAALSAKSATKKIPVVFSAVADPVASGLVANTKTSGTNITGTTDEVPVEEQILFFRRLVPNMKSLAILHTAGDQNAEIQASRALALAEENGIHAEIKTVNHAGDISQVTKSFMGNFDAIYIPSDNELAEQQAISAIKIGTALPVFVGDKDMVLKGGLATAAVDYVELGKKSGEMAVKILTGASPATLPIESGSAVKYYVNKSTAASLGITIPEDAEALE